MKNLKRLCIAVALTLAIGCSAFAGEIPSPPCTPGEIDSPPCATTQLSNDDELTQQQTLAVVAADESALSTRDVAFDLLHAVLSLF